MSARSGVRSQASTDQRGGLGAALGLVIGLLVAWTVYLVAISFFTMTKDIMILLFGVMLGLVPALVLGVVLFFVLWNREGTARATTGWMRHPG